MLRPTIQPHYGPSNPPPGRDADGALRVAQVVALRPEREDEYRRLHAEAFPQVLLTLSRAGIHNYNIFLGKVAGQKLLFSYFEFVGSDYAAACAEIAACPHSQRWWQLTDPCQQQLPGTLPEQLWLPLERLFVYA